MSKSAGIIGGIVVFIIFSVLLAILKIANIQLGAIPYAGIFLLFFFIFSRVTGRNMWTMKLQELVVSKVLDGSKANIAGIKVKDIIVSVCDKNTKTLSDLFLILNERDKVKPVKVILKRGKDIISLEIFLDENEKSP